MAAPVEYFNTLLGVEADVSADFDSLFNDVLDKVNMKAAA